jgi:hypothetical protein
MPREYAGITREARWLIAGLAPGQSVVVPWREGMARREWRSRVAAVAIGLWGRGECRTAEEVGGVRVLRRVREAA